MELQFKIAKILYSISQAQTSVKFQLSIVKVLKITIKLIL